MSNCRYIPEAQLPQTATDQEITAILAALSNGRYKIVSTALRYIVGPWGMSTASFVEAIQAHLATNCRLFRKVVRNPPENTFIFGANIGLDPDSDDEDDDVYVEIRLQNRDMVIICDAHTHARGQPRLPK